MTERSAPNVASQPVPAPGERRRDWQPDPRFIRYLIVGIVGINVLVAAALAYVFADSRRSEEGKFRAAATNLARLIGKDVDSQYGRIDLSLRAVADEHAGQLARGRQHFERWIVRVSDRHPPVNFIWISDADGRIIHSPENSLGSGVDVSDRDYFIRLRDDPQLGLAISPPLTGRISGKTVLAMARRLGAKDARFSGVAVASVPVADIEGLLRGLRSGAESYIGLLDAELRWIAAAPGLPAGVTPGTALRSAALRDALAAASAGAVTMHGEDGSEQLVSYARSATYGFTVVLAQPATVPLADWWRKVVAGSLALALFAVLTTLLGWLLHRSWQQQAAVTDALRHSEQLFRSVFENSMVGMATTSPEKGWLTVNRRLCDILGYDRDELQRMSWSDVTHPDDLASDVAFFERVLAGEIDAYEIDKRYIRKDGAVIDAYIAARAMRRPDGSIDHFIALVQDITSRKRTEEQLRASEADLSAALDQAAAGIAFVAPDGRWLRVNERLCQLAGYSQAELLTLTFQDITHPDDLELDLTQLARLVRGEIDRYTLEKRYFRKDGRCVWINLSVSLIRNGDGTPNHFVSIIEDIDARKTAERDLARSREILKNFLDHLPGMAYVKDQDLRILHANRSVAEFLNLDPEQVVGRSNAELFPGEFGDKISRDDRRVLASGQTECLEEAYAGGFYQTTKFVVRQDDRPALLGGITLDITRRHQLEERTRALLKINDLGRSLGEKEFLAACLEMAERMTASGIGFLHFVNDDQQTIELSTWTAGALKGCCAMFDSHYPIKEAGIWADCCRQRRAVCFNDYAAYEAKRGLPEGHAPLQRLIAVPVIEEGRVRMVVGVGNKAATYDDFDVETVQLVGNEVWSIRRRAQAEAALAHRLAEVTELNGKLEDAHLQLLQSEKMSAIGQLAAGVAHELNNPIGFVHSNLGTLGEYVEDLLAIDAAYARVEAQLPALAGPGALDEVRRLKAASDHPYLVEDLPKLIRESKEGLERVHRIVLDLRDFSRVGESEWQWTDLEKGLESTINIVWNELKYKAEVERRYTPLPPIRCLASQLNQVFMNLLINAAQAIETRGRIVIRTGTDAASTDAASAVDSVWVEIEDSGCGMPPEVQKHLFEPFFTTKPVGKGTGLGLSIAFAIIARHHGRFDVRSEVGRGTTFRITLPIDPSQAETGTE